MNKHLVCACLLAGLVLTLPASLRAFNKTELAVLQQQATLSYEDYARVSAEKSISTFYLLWRDRNNPSRTAETRCRGVLLAGAPRVATAERCFKRAAALGGEFTLVGAEVSLQNKQRVNVNLSDIQYSGVFAVVPLSRQAAQGLGGVQVELVPGDQSLPDFFGGGAPYMRFTFRGKTVNPGHFFRNAAQFDLDSWRTGALIGEPLFHQHKLLAINSIEAELNITGKGPGPLFFLVNEANGGKALVQ